MSVLQIKDIQQRRIQINYDFTKTTAVSIFPFRVAFKTLDYAGYSLSNPAPIGIAVIGVNNYIL